MQADFILLSHGHADHVGDTVEIAKRTGATVVAAYELAALAEEKGCESHGMACGGGHAFDFGHVKLVPAAHGSLNAEQARQQLARSVRAAAHAAAWRR